MATAEDEVVLLLHGFGCHRYFMLPLSMRLRGRGFQTRLWTYPSVRCSIADNGERLRAYWARHLSSYRRVHFVGHSLGTIVFRAAAAPGPPPNLGNAVLLTPPNYGSPVARHAAQLTGGRIQPLRELADRPTSYVNCLPPWSGGHLGVIAARCDLLVPRVNAQLPSATDYVEVPGMHSYVLVSRRAAELTGRFLRQGHF